MVPERPPNPSRKLPLASPPPVNSIPAAATGSPFSPTPFSGGGGGASASAATSSEQTCVSLYDWWLVRVEGAEKKIAVAGFTTRKRAVRIFTSAPIIKRYDACTLETADGIIVLIQGMLNISRTHQSGFSHELSDRFLIGFPIGWDDCTDLYIKQATAHAGSPPNSSTTASSLKVSSQAYYEKFLLGSLVNSLGSVFMGNLVKTAKKFSDDNTDTAPIQRCSHLSNETPRLQESTRNIDDNGSSMSKRTTSAISDNSKGCSAVSDEMGNERMNLPAGNIFREAYPDDVHPLSPFLAAVETCNSGQVEKEAEIQNENMHTDATEQEKVYHPVNSVLINDRSADHMSCDLEGDGSTACLRSSVDLGSKDVSTMVAPKGTNCSHFELAEGSENIAIRRLRNGKKFCVSNISPYNSFDHGAFENVVTGVLSLDSERTPEASLKKQAYRKRMQHEAVNEKMVPNEETTTPSTPSVLISQENGKLLVAPVEERSSGDKVLQATTRSRMFKSPRSYVHQSPLTRNKAKQLSVSTPESLKLRRTRSGRVIVPRLDLGCQKIFYDGVIFCKAFYYFLPALVVNVSLRVQNFLQDGSIAGIVGAEELRSCCKGSKSEPAKRRKRSH